MHKKLLLTFFVLNSAFLQGMNNSFDINNNSANTDNSLVVPKKESNLGNPYAIPYALQNLPVDFPLDIKRVIFKKVVDDYELAAKKEFNKLRAILFINFIFKNMNAVYETLQDEKWRKESFAPLRIEHKKYRLSIITKDFANTFFGVGGRAYTLTNRMIYEEYLSDRNKGIALFINDMKDHDKRYFYYTTNDKFVPFEQNFTDDELKLLVMFKNRVQSRLKTKNSKLQHQLINIKGMSYQEKFNTYAAANLLFNSDCQQSLSPKFRHKKRKKQQEEIIKTISYAAIYLHRIVAPVNVLNDRYKNVCDSYKITNPS